MEGGGGGTMGPTINTNSHSQSHSRPVRTSSRYLYGNSPSSSSPATFRGPVRRWEKKWVQVSSSQHSTTTPNKPRKLSLSNGSKSPNSPILLCKWTPLSRPPTSSTAASSDGDSNSGQLSRRKFRYTPITVFEEKKKRTAKEVAKEDKAGEDNQSADMSAMDSDDIYGLPDINSEYMGARQRTSDGDLIYSRRSHLNLGLQLENKKKGGKSDLNVTSFCL